MSIRRNHKDREQLIAGYLFGDLNDEDRARFDSLLEQGEIDRQEIADLQETLAIASLHAPEEPQQEFWRNFYPNLASGMETQHWAAPARRIRQWITDLRLAIVPEYRWITQVALALIVLLVGVLLGRTVFSPDPYSGPGPRTAQAHNDVPLPTAAAHEYLGRSKMLLLGIVHADADDPTALNLPRRKEMARELVRTAADIKPSLEDADLRRLHELVSEIEMILIQIANLEEENDFPAIEIVRRGVERKGLLFKINVEEMRRLEKDEAAESEDDSGHANTAQS